MRKKTINRNFVIFRIIVVLYLFVLASCGGGGNGGGGSSSSGDTSYEDSPFGIFAAFATEFNYFEERMGFTKEDYWNWASNHMKNLGSHWTRSNLQLIWDFVEPEMGKGYNWDNEFSTDSVIRSIYDSGHIVHWLGVFHEGSGAVDPGKPSLRNPLDYPDEYKAFVRAVVERYDGDGIGDVAPGVKVKYWQAGNEIFHWKDTGRTVDDYIQFVRMIREAALQADPKAKIALVAPTDGFTVDPFLVEVIDALAVERGFDVIDVHHWGNAQNWKMPAVLQYREILDSKGLVNVEIWSTEHGTWQGQPAGQPLQTEQDQANSLIKRYGYNLANGLNKLFWNNLMEWYQFAGDSGSIFNSIGLITDGQGIGEDPALFNTKRLSYYSYKLMTEKLEGSDWDNIQTIQESGNVYIYKFTKSFDGAQDKSIYVAWWDYFDDTGASKTITFNVDFTGNALVTKVVPNADSGLGLDENDYPDFFDKETKTVSNGQVTITLDENPVFVEVAL